MIIFGIIALKLFNNSRFTKRWSWMGIFVTITAFIMYGLCSRVEYMKTIELFLVLHLSLSNRIKVIVKDLYYVIFSKKDSAFFQRFYYSIGILL